MFRNMFYEPENMFLWSDHVLQMVGMYATVVTRAVSDMIREASSSLCHMHGCVFSSHWFVDNYHKTGYPYGSSGSRVEAFGRSHLRSSGPDSHN